MLVLERSSARAGKERGEDAQLEEDEQRDCHQDLAENVGRAEDRRADEDEHDGKPLVLHQ